MLQFSRKEVIKLRSCSTCPMLAGAVVAIAQGRSSDPHKFAEAVCGTIMDRIDKPNITKPSQQLS